MSKTKQRLIVHINLYKGRKIEYKKGGEITTDGWINKLVYGDSLYFLFIENIRKNGFLMEDDSAKEAVVKVVSNDWDNETNTWSEDFEEVKDPKVLNPIIEQIQKVYDGDLPELSGKDKEIADMRAELNEMRELVASLTKGKEESTPAAEETKAEYEKVFGKKPHHMKSNEALLKEIADKTNQ